MRRGTLLSGLLRCAAAAALSPDPHDDVAFFAAIPPRPAAARWGPDSLVFASHMVLASSDVWSGGSTPATVWGTGVPGEAVTVSGLPAGAVAPNPFTVPASGNWSISVSVRASLTPYTLAFNSTIHGVVLDDVLFGHTFLCSGQSNMDFPTSCAYGANEAFEAALALPEIRVMNQGASGKWQAANLNTSSPTANALYAFSATCFFTALHLKLNVPAFKNVPLGLVRSSVGGQCIERFMTPAALEAVGVPAVNATGISCGQTAHVLYDQLIAPLIPFVFKTMVWYQGECNVFCNSASSPSWLTNYYSRLLPQLVTTWREAFGTPFTALIVQLAAYNGSDPMPVVRSYDPLPKLRESQYSVLTLQRTAVATAINIGNPYNASSPCRFYAGGVHPRNKTEVGRRLALKLAEVEGVLPVGVVATGPEPSAFSAAGAAVTITIDAASAPGGTLALVPTEDCLSFLRVGATLDECCQVEAPATPPNANANASFPFELLLADQTTFVLATATLGSATILVAPLNASHLGPFTGVRYSWQGFPLCAVLNGQGLPMAPFTHTI